MEIPANTDLTTSPILVTANPTGLANDLVVGLPANLASIQAAVGDFSGIASIESIQIGEDGTAYLTADLADGTGAILIVDQPDDLTTTRIISGPNTGLVAPKGLDVVDGSGLIVVADFGASDIKVFRVTDQGDVNPVFTAANLGGTRSVWDVDHDPASDLLFAAGTDGAYLIYQDFATRRGTAAPNQVITPLDGLGGKISANLHGIVYLSNLDTLLLSDVGSAASASDGQIFVVEKAAQAVNTTPILTRIGGPDTRLGNPVDIAFDGANLYIAEKANDLVLRYDGILTRGDLITGGAELSIAITKAESVVIR
jgi:hypothetical protein